MRQLGVLLGSVAVAFAGAVHTSDAAIIWDPSDSAVSYSLSEINAAGGLTVIDKTFADFIVVTGGSVGISFPDVDSIRVRPSITSTGNVRIDFHGGWATATDQHVNTNIQFSLTTEQPWLLDGVRLGLTSFFTNFDGFISIAENIWADEDLTEPLGQLGVAFVKDDPANQIVDFLPLDPTNKVWIVKDITVRGGRDSLGEIGHAHMSRFYQEFTQIPEPATLTVMGLGGLLMLRRRRA